MINVNLSKPAAVKNFKAETIKADTVKLTWKKESNIDGYRLYVKEDTAGSSWTKQRKTKVKTGKIQQIIILVQQIVIIVLQLEEIHKILYKLQTQAQKVLIFQTKEQNNLGF